MMKRILLHAWTRSLRAICATLILFCFACLGVASAQCVPPGCTDYTIVVASNVACSIDVASVWGTNEHDRGTIPPGVGAIHSNPCDGTTFAGARVYDDAGVPHFVPFSAPCPPGQANIRIKAGCCIRVCASLDAGGCPEIRITAVLPACP